MEREGGPRRTRRMAYDNKPARARPGFSPVEYIAEYIFEAYMVAMFKAKNTYSTSYKGTFLRAGDFLCCCCAFLRGMMQDVLDDASGTSRLFRLGSVDKKYNMLLYYNFFWVTTYQAHHGVAEATRAGPSSPPLSGRLQLQTARGHCSD